MSVFFSIIIPLYNAEEYCLETFKSLELQTISDFEVVIIDDKSTDDSYIIAEKFCLGKPNFYLIKSNSNLKGASVCRNIGLNIAKGKYIIFLDADDILKSDCLEFRKNYLTNKPNDDFAVFKMKYFYNKPEDSDEIFNTYCENRLNYLKEFIGAKIPWQTTCIAWKSNFLKENNYTFDEKFPRLQDVEFHTRILLNDKINFSSNQNLSYDSYYRIHKNTKSRFTKNFVKNVLTGYNLYYDLLIMNKSFLQSNEITHNSIEEFIKSSVNSLLIHLKIYDINSTLKYILKVRSNKKYFLPVYLMFILLNILRLNYVKGIGVSRFYNFIFKR